MGKLARRKHRGHGGANGRQRLTRLKEERRALAVQMAKVDEEISKLTVQSNGKRRTAQEFDRWFEELAEGLPILPALPADFSRADLYKDHD